MAKKPKLPDVKKTKALLEEFKAFALKGRVVDLAIGVIIGGAFSGITTSLVNDVIMPFVGMFVGGVDFSSWVVMLPALFAEREPTPLKIGNFIQTVVNFLLLAMVVFILVKLLAQVYKAKEEKPAEPAAPAADVVLLTEIRDLLKAQGEQSNG